MYEVVLGPDLRVKFLISGCRIYEKGCGWSNTKLPESSLQATMSPSQCHLACMADFICF